MKVISRALVLEAVQWEGTVASLQQIQQLIAPRSPYWDGESKHLGVPTSKADPTAYLKIEMKHIDIGGWVVSQDGRVLVHNDEQFKSLYATPELITPLPLDALSAACDALRQQEIVKEIVGGLYERPEPMAVAPAAPSVLPADHVFTRMAALALRPDLSALEQAGPADGPESDLELAHLGTLVDVTELSPAEAIEALNEALRHAQQPPIRDGAGLPDPNADDSIPF